MLQVLLLRSLFSTSFVFSTGNSQASKYAADGINMMPLKPRTEPGIMESEIGSLIMD